MPSENPPIELTAKTKEPQYAHVPWGSFLAVVYAVVSFGLITQLIVPVALYSALLFGGATTQQALNELQNSIGWQFVYVLLAETLTFGAIFWFVRKRGAKLRLIGWRRIRWTDPLVTVCGYVVYFIAYAVLLAIATHVSSSVNVNQKQELGFDNVNGVGNILLTFVSLVILPPIVEETVFRGFVFTSLRKNLRLIWAMLITSLLFATAHLEFGNGKPLLWVAGIDTFTLSLVLCYMREKTDSLWPGILLHALKNCIAFVSLYLLHLG